MVITYLAFHNLNMRGLAFSSHKRDGHLHSVIHPIYLGQGSLERMNHSLEVLAPCSSQGT